MYDWDMNNDEFRFKEQCEYVPVIENKEKLGNYTRFVVMGMGGSNIAAEFIKAVDPLCDITIHRDYGVPFYLKNDGNTLIVISSYSGNTEETLDAYRVAREKEFPIVVITQGGELLSWAQEDYVPYIALPHIVDQPRMAVILSLKALCACIKNTKALEEIKKCGTIDFKACEFKGRELAELLRDKVPLIWSSLRSKGIGYFWKIHCNETAKIPAFSNILPEATHNEIEQWDNQKNHLVQNMYPIILVDAHDDPRIVKRFEIVKALYEEHNIAFSLIEMKEDEFLPSLIGLIAVGAYMAWNLGEYYAVDQRRVPLIENLKQQLKEK